MTRVLSGAALVVVAVSVVWLAPPALFFAVAEILLLLAFIEYRRLAEAVGLPVRLACRPGAGSTTPSSAWPWRSTPR